MGSPPPGDPRDRIHVFEDPEAWRHHPFDPLRDHLVVTPGGVFVAQRSALCRHIRPATAEDFQRIFGGSVPTQQSCWGGGVELAHRVPLHLLSLATAFFRQVWVAEEREEILLLYFFYEEGRYTVEHPEILSAGAHHVRYTVPETPADAVRFGSFHSHGWDAAYHSLTDERSDVGSPGIHVILGDVGESLPTIVCIFSDGTACFPVSPWDIFVEPEPIAVPKEWLVPIRRPPEAAGTGETPTEGEVHHGELAGPDVDLHRARGDL